LVRSGDFDICIYGATDRFVHPEGGIHVWVSDADDVNTNFMILLGYIIMSHPDWRHSHIKIFLVSQAQDVEQSRSDLAERIAEGRLPITLTNIEIVTMEETTTIASVISERSHYAALTMIGFGLTTPPSFFTSFKIVGDTLFVSASREKEIG
jgi:hypothetical protein